MVDYTATSARPQWHELPVQVRDACEDAVGGAVVRAGRSVGAGFTGGLAAPLLLADGREVFVKAAPDRLLAYQAYQREAAVVPELPGAVAVPSVVATAHAVAFGERWFAVVADRIHGRMPGNPWTVEDFDLVAGTCASMAGSLTPSPLAGVRPFAETLEAEDALARMARMRDADLPVPSGFEPWLPGRLPELADLVDRHPVALAGTSAMHGDLRPDNLLVDGSGRCWVLDWNFVSLGPAWADWVGLLPRAHHHGIDTAAAIRASSLTASVPPDDLDCFAAILASCMLQRLDRPPWPGTTPVLRQHQRLVAWEALAWLASRRGW